MIHAICDFCGKDADLNATYLTMTPFENFGRYHHMSKPFGNIGKTKAFCLCSDCREKKGLPNPYSDYHNVEELSYNRPIDSRTEDDWIQEDVDRDPHMQQILQQINQSQSKPNPSVTTTIQNTDNDPEDVHLLGFLNTESEGQA